MSSTIYSLKTGYTITEGVQSQAASNATINTALRQDRSYAHKQEGTACARGLGQFRIVAPTNEIWRMALLYAP